MLEGWQTAARSLRNDYSTAANTNAPFGRRRLRDLTVL